jgi:hypothetical protein
MDSPRPGPAAITLKPISNAACKPQARDSDMTAAEFVRRSETLSESMVAGLTA